MLTPILTVTNSLHHPVTIQLCDSYEDEVGCVHCYKNAAQHHTTISERLADSHPQSMVVQRSGAITAVKSERGQRSGSFVPTLKHAIEYLLAPDQSQGYQRPGRSSILLAASTIYSKLVSYIVGSSSNVRNRQFGQRVDFAKSHNSDSVDSIVEQMTVICCRGKPVEAC